MPRYDAESALYLRWAGLLNFVYQKPPEEFDNAGLAPPQPVAPVTNQAVSPNPQAPTPLYNDPLGYALSTLGRPAASPATIADADVDAIGGRWFAMLDLAEYRLIRSMLGSFTDVTESDNGHSASYNQLADRAMKRAEDLEKQYEQYLMPYRGGASSGAIRHVSPTAFAPRYGPGYGGPSRRGFGGCGGGPW